MTGRDSIQQGARVAASIDDMNHVLTVADNMHRIGFAPSQSEAQRQIALRLAAPKRANAGKVIAPQDDASDCPLFRAANEPRLI